MTFETISTATFPATAFISSFFLILYAFIVSFRAWEVSLKRRFNESDKGLFIFLFVVTFAFADELLRGSL